MQDDNGQWQAFMTITMSQQLPDQLFKNFSRKALDM